ncbi:MAG: PEP-CTERM sorting domain-containing protein [Phycisphaerales bacterium]|nr:PEP-CTERM sorting domain-containing protein [Phycisphaerales bacterium]
MRAQLIVGSLAGLLMAGTVNAAVVWDTGDPLSQGYNEFDAPVTGYTVDSPSAGLLTQDTTLANTSRYALTSASAELVNSAGWYIEWRVNPQNTSGSFGVGLYANDSAGGIQLSTDPSGWGSWNGGSGSYATGYHIFRLTRAPGGSDFQLQVDGGAPTTLSQYVPWGGASAMQWGDVSSGNSGQAEWDYVAVNSAVPEPTSLALLGLGATLLVRRRMSKSA